MKRTLVVETIKEPNGSMIHNKMRTFILSDGSVYRESLDKNLWWLHNIIPKGMSIKKYITNMDPDELIIHCQELLDFIPRS